MRARCHAVRATVAVRTRGPGARRRRRATPAGTGTGRALGVCRPRRWCGGAILTRDHATSACRLTSPRCCLPVAGSIDPLPAEGGEMLVFPLPQEGRSEANARAAREGDGFSQRVERRGIMDDSMTPAKPPLPRNVRLLIGM